MNCGRLGRLGKAAWTNFLWSQIGLAEIIIHHVQCRQEGVFVDHTEEGIYNTLLNYVVDSI